MIEYQHERILQMNRGEILASENILRIAHVIGRLKRDGGAEKLLHTFAEAVADLNIRLTIITLRENDPQVEKVVEDHGARVVAFPGQKLGNPIRLWNLFRFVRREQFDVLHTHLSDATILGTFIGRLLGVPVVSTLHNTKMVSQDNPIRARIEPQLYRYGVSEVIAVGWTTASFQKERIKDKHISVVPNAVPPVNDLNSSERKQLRHELVGNVNHPILISVGRLTSQKGFFDLLTAFTLIQQSHPETHLIIAGQGPLEKELAIKIQQLNIQEKVNLLGVRSDVPRLLAASDIYVSASHWEGLPVATLEAMSAGLPIVATRVGDVPHVVVKGTGVLVPPKQPEQLSEAVLSLLDDAGMSQSFGKSARNHVTNSFSVDNWVKQQIEIYQGVMNT